MISLGLITPWARGQRHQSCLRRRGINRLTMSFEGAKSESHILRADGAHLGRVRCRLWRWTIDKTVEFNYKISSRLNFFFTLEISVYCRSLRKCLKYKKKLRAVFYCIATEARRRSVKQTHMFPPWKKDSVPECEFFSNAAVELIISCVTDHRFTRWVVSHAVSSIFGED